MLARRSEVEERHPARRGRLESPAVEVPVFPGLPLLLLLAAGMAAPALPRAEGRWGVAAGPPGSTGAPPRPSGLGADLAREERRPEGPSELLGRWVMESEPGKVLELKAGGTGTFHGAPLTWSVDGSRLTVTDSSGTDTTGWTVTGDRLVLAGPFGIEIVFRRETARPEGQTERRPRPRCEG
jgi:hypothetical protein